MHYLYTVITENGNSSYVFDSSDILPFVIFGLIVLAIVLFIIMCIVNIIKSRKKAMKQLENLEEEIPLVEIDARVLKKECFVKTYGVKMPETRKEFYITFLAFDGKTKRYSVSEELYLSVDEGFSGTIALLNDNFFDFYF